MRYLTLSQDGTPESAKCHTQLLGRRQALRVAVPPYAVAEDEVPHPQPLRTEEPPHSRFRACAHARKRECGGSSVRSG